MCPPLPTFADARGGGVLGLPTSAILHFVILSCHIKYCVQRFIGDGGPSKLAIGDHPLCIQYCVCFTTPTKRKLLLFDL